LARVSIRDFATATCGGDEPLVARHGLCRLVHVHGDRGELVLGLEVLRVERLGLEEGGLRLPVVAQAELEDAQRVLQPAALLVCRGPLLDHVHGQLPLASLGEHRRQAHVSIHEPGVELERASVGGLRLRPVALGLVRGREAVVDERDLGGPAGDRLVLRGRLVRLALPKEGGGGRELRAQAGHVRGGGTVGGREPRPGRRRGRGPPGGQLEVRRLLDAGELLDVVVERDLADALLRERDAVRSRVDVQVDELTLLVGLGLVLLDDVPLEVEHDLDVRDRVARRVHDPTARGDGALAVGP
jgi:hypothetical protein